MKTYDIYIYFIFSNREERIKKILSIKKKGLRVHGLRVHVSLLSKQNDIFILII